MIRTLSLTLLVFLLSAAAGGRVSAWKEVKKKFYSSGELKQVIPYEDGEIDGRMQLYNKEGDLTQEIIFDMGKKERAVVYYENGMVAVERHYVDGKLEGVEKGYYENGAIKTETPYSKGEIDGNVRGYSKNGNISVITPYGRGFIDGIEKAYYEDGAVKHEIRFKRSVMEGESVRYENDGSYSVIPYKEGLRHGTVRHYDREGNLVREEEYKKGWLKK